MQNREVSGNATTKQAMASSALSSSNASAISAPSGDDSLSTDMQWYWLQEITFKDFILFYSLYIFKYIVVHDGDIRET